MMISSWHRPGWLAAIATLVGVMVALAIGIAISSGQIELVLLIGGGLVVPAAIFWRPAFGATLILGLAPLEGTVALGGASTAKLVTAYCIAVLIARLLIFRVPLEFDRVTWLIMLFVGWAFVTILWSTDQEAGLESWISFALQSMLYVILLNLIKSKQDLKLAIWGHVLGGIVLSIILTYNIVSRDFLRRDEFGGLGINLAARMASLTLVLAVLLYQLENHRLAKVVLLLSIIPTASAVVVSLSRGAWFGTTLSLLTFFVVIIWRGQTARVTRLLVWAPVIVVSFYVVTTFLLSDHGGEKLVDRFQSGFSGEDDAGHRFDIWRVGLEMFREQPLWGHGFDSFERDFPHYVARLGLYDIFFDGEIKQPHNAFMRVLVDMGMIGLFLFLAILVVFFRRAWRVLHDRQANATAVACGMSLIAFVLNASMVDSSVDRKYLWYILAIIMFVARYWTSDVPIPNGDRSEVISSSGVIA
jgi:exopolysaccharide production protein ExoQ